MALDKNKTGIMAAISAAQTGKAPIGERAHRSLPKGTIGSVRAGLGGIQEIETNLIEGWGPQDRLKLTAVNSENDDLRLLELADSIAQSGQQVPVLLRPSAERDGYFQVIYGRRRVLACIHLGQPVKALIRTMDDTEALKAKGLENAARSDLSYYERARFASAILKQGYSREETLQALAISKNTLSQLERVARLIPDDIGSAIGAAPGAGRPKWMALALAFEGGTTGHANANKVVQEALASVPSDASSDDRLGAVLTALSARGAKEHRVANRNPVPGVAIKSGKSSVSLTVKRTGQEAAFADWFDENIDRLVAESYAAFSATQEKT